LIINQVFELLGRKAVASVTEYSILSFKCIVELLQFTFNISDCQVSNRAGAILRSNFDFVKYITALALNKISQVTVSTTTTIIIIIIIDIIEEYP